MANVRNMITQLQGKTLQTLYRPKPFRVVSVQTDSVRVIPEEGKGKIRPIRLDRIEELFRQRLGKDELRRQALRLYPESRNTSYMAAIVHAISTDAVAAT